MPPPQRFLEDVECAGDPVAVGGSWSPKIDVIERGKYLLARVDLPGVNAKDVTVSVTGDRLVVAGERGHGTETRDRYWRSERDYGCFRRVVPLPAGIQRESVRATFEGGVLEVSMPLPVAGAVKATRVPIVEGNKAHRAA